MNRRLVFFGLLAGALLFAGQALAATVAKPSGIAAPSADADGTYTITLGSSSTIGCTYVLFESKDGGPSLEINRALNRQYQVTGRTIGSYAYRAQAIKDGMDPSLFTATVTTAVTSLDGKQEVSAPTGITAPANDTDGSFAINLGASRTTGVITYVIEESVNGGVFTPIYSGTSRQFFAANKPSGAKYAYRAKATKPPLMADSAYTTTVITYVSSSSYCSTCHTGNQTAWAASSHGNGNGWPGVYSNSCSDCHSPTRELANGAMAVTCLACHSVSGTATVGAQADHPGTVAADALATCAKCHDSHLSASSTIASSWAASLHNNGTNSCVTCHDPHTLAYITCTTASCHATGGTPGLPHNSDPLFVACTDCHDPHSTAPVEKLKIATGHALVGQVAVSNVKVIGGASVVMTFNVKVDGVNANNFTFTPAGYSYAASATPTAAVATFTPPAPIANDFTRTVVNPAVVSNGNGNYTATWAGAAPTGSTTYMVTVSNAAALPKLMATSVGYLNGNPRNLVSNDGCIGCHGNQAFRSGSHHSANPQGVEACVVCHTRATSVSRGAGGDRTTAYVHGIHASEQAMPSGGYDRTFPQPVPRIPDFMVAYPTYMTNCAVCHSTPTQLAAVNAAPVSYSLCFSCHDDWTGFASGTTVFGGEDHAAFNWGTACVDCHDGSYAGDTVSDFHNGLLTERSGLIYNGQDVSVVEGAKINMQITGVTRTNNDLAVTWTTTYNGAPVNPCNATVAVGAPIFYAGGAAVPATGQVAANLTFLRGFAQGDDWVNADIATAPGQALNTTVTTANTVCTNNVATTTFTLTATEIATTATKGVLALQGKPQIKVGYSVDSPITPAVETRTVFQVRAKTPTREFVVSSGAEPTTLRREIIDTAACLKCHVGSLYQHGGNRIDNVDMCILCHNEASSDQNNRFQDGVDANEAYDGKASQTYGFKSLLHKIHSSAETGVTTETHRISNGIYVWTGEMTTVPNWPATTPATVYGSSPTVSRAHTLYRPVYPRDLRNCTSCHKPDTFGLPDPTKAVATTVNAGTVTVGTVQNSVLTDDVLQGPAAAACMTCHQSSDPVIQARLTSHANQGGFVPAVLPGGRAAVLNGVVTEKCSNCHE